MTKPMPETMSADRAEQFKADIADMKLKTSNSSKDQGLQILGAVLMVVGIVVAFIAWRASLNVKVAKSGSNADLLDSSSYTSQALTGVAVAVVGSALYLRCALAKFLRLWLLRQIYENRAQTDEIVATVTQR